MVQTIHDIVLDRDTHSPEEIHARLHFYVDHGAWMQMIHHPDASGALIERIYFENFTHIHHRINGMMQVLSHPNTPDTVFCHFLDNNDRISQGMRAIMAKHENMSANSLRKLWALIGGNQNFDVRVDILLRRDCPKEITESSHNMSTILAGFVRPTLNGKVTIRETERVIAQDMSHAQRREFIALMQSDSDSRMRYFDEVITCPELTQAEFSDLANIAHAHIQLNRHDFTQLHLLPLINHRLADASVIQMLSKNFTTELELVAQCIYTPSKVLEELVANSLDSHVIAHLLRNPTLSGDSISHLLRRCIESSSTQKSTSYIRLNKNMSWESLFEAVFNHPNARYGEVQAVLSLTSRNSFLRREITSRATDVTKLIALCNHAELGNGYTDLLSNPNLPIALVRLLHERFIETTHVKNSIPKPNKLFGKIDGLFAIREAYFDLAPEHTLNDNLATHAMMIEED